MLYFPVIIMGASSIILQILCLRQLLATFSGNELIIGITLAVWLVFVAVGSWSGSKLRFKNAFGWSFLLVSLLSQATILFIKVIRPMTGFGLGEVIPLPMTILWTVFAMSALCISIGTQFPLAVSYLREKAADVYSLEAAGAFAGGACFTFFLAGNIDIYKLVMLTAIINIFVSFYLLRKKAVLLLFTLPVVFYYGSMNFLHSHQHKGIELIKRSESRYGEIMVLKTNDQLNIYSSEKFQFSYPDPQAEEMKTHLPMSLHPDAGKILVVGGSPAVIREFLKYPVSGIDFVEIDPAVIEISRELLSREDREYLNDPRVKIFHIDARRYIKSLRADNYDLIVLNIPEPSTANVNRYYTREFFSETKSALKGHGLLFMSLPVSYGYISRRMQTANGSVYASLKEVFPYAGVSSEEYGIILASDAPVETDPDALTGRFLKRGIDTKYFRPYILKDAFSPLQVSMVKGRLGRIKELNTDRRPVSYLYNLMLWSEIHGGKWLNPALGLGEYEIMIAIGIVLIIVTCLFIKNGETVPYVLFTTGYITMAFVLIVILIYQAHSGYVYETIGLLTGTFMLGGAAGAYIMRDIKRPIKLLRLFDFLTIILMASAILFMKSGPFFYIFIFAAGVLGGGQFAAANLAMKQEGKGGMAGKLYAVDIAGSFLGSFATAIFMVPLAGVRNTIVFLICVKTVSLGLLIRYRNQDSI